ncbi:division/cell wall cluster transcriptional repressor MraZ [Desulfobulbus oralis]|uniref:Transcriptional regulator MraZ n=1 Tax=Desulfobulbus oralis TaxID=1986146 RepID=A0A2L1GL18_9BACT|nr:division/cell wall cluster transcriptional repressor MraZ [Desulfobulbus oralis]AVD70317.1 division/cell wall cluster transcriptional repressor MraZ [Desulfobulbus oralis]
MLQFEGNSEHGLDPKGRLNIPARFREVLKEVYDTEMLKVTLWRGCLRAYPLPEWEDLMRKLSAEALTHRKGSQFIRMLVSNLVECPVDKQGRILIPPRMRNDAGIGSEVVLAGVLQYFEIWDKAAWEREFAEMYAAFDDYEEIMATVGVL